MAGQASCGNGARALPCLRLATGAPDRRSCLHGPGIGPRRPAQVRDAGDPGKMQELERHPIVGVRDMHDTNLSPARHLSILRISHHRRRLLRLPDSRDSGCCRTRRNRSGWLLLERGRAESIGLRPVLYRLRTSTLTQRCEEAHDQGQILPKPSLRLTTGTWK